MSTQPKRLLSPNFHWAGNWDEQDFQLPSKASHTKGTQPQAAESQVRSALQVSPISFIHHVLWFVQLGLTNHRNVPFDNLWKMLILQSWYHMGFGLLYLPIPKVTLRWGLHNANCPGEITPEITRRPKEAEGLAQCPGLQTRRRILRPKLKG